MNAPFNGWAIGVSLQKETAFNAASSEPVYNLTGKTKLTQSAEFSGKGVTVNVWRNASESYFAGKFFQGVIELELGLNDVIRLLLSGFFEVESSEQIPTGIGTEIFGEGGQIYGEGIPVYGESGQFLTQFTLRPPRLKSFQSFKLCLDFDGAPEQLLGSGLFGEGGEIFGEGGTPLITETPIIANATSVLYSGLVIDALVFDIRRNQVPKVSVQFKAASREIVNAPGLENPQTNDVRRVHHQFAAATMDSQPLLALFEVNLSFNQRKTPSRFGSDKKPTRFGCEPFIMTGQLAEYFGPDSRFPQALTDQNDHSLNFTLNDPAGTPRKLQFVWPRINFNDSLPDGIGRADLTYRAGFSGLQDLEQDAATAKIILVV